MRRGGACSRQRKVTTWSRAARGHEEATKRQEESLTLHSCSSRLQSWRERCSPSTNVCSKLKNTESGTSDSSRPMLQAPGAADKEREPSRTALLYMHHAPKPHPRHDSTHSPSPSPRTGRSRVAITCDQSSRVVLQTSANPALLLTPPISCSLIQHNTARTFREPRPPLARDPHLVLSVRAGTSWPTLACKVSTTRAPSMPSTQHATQLIVPTFGGDTCRLPPPLDKAR